MQTVSSMFRSIGRKFCVTYSECTTCSGKFPKKKKNGKTEPYCYDCKPYSKIDQIDDAESSTMYKSELDVDKKKKKKTKKIKVKKPLTKYPVIDKPEEEMTEEEKYMTAYNHVLTYHPKQRKRVPSSSEESEGESYTWDSDAEVEEVFSPEPGARIRKRSRLCWK